MTSERVRLPELREASRPRARFVRLTFGVVISWLALLALGAVWAMQTLRFDLDLPVTGQVVAVDADGAARLVLISGGGAPAAPRIGDVAELKVVATEDTRWIGEVVALDSGRIEVVIDEASDLAIGTSVEGQLVRHRQSIVDLLKVIHSAGP